MNHTDQQQRAKHDRRILNSERTPHTTRNERHGNQCGCSVDGVGHNPISLSVHVGLLDIDLAPIAIINATIPTVYAFFAENRTMTRGRPRKHAQIKLLDGTFRHNRDDMSADTRPANGECKPVRPLNEHGQMFFDSVLRAYPAGTLGESDSESLTLTAESVQVQFELHKLYAEAKLGIAAYIKLKGEINKQYWQGAVRFGLSPADRGKVKLSSPPESELKSRKFLG